MGAIQNSLNMLVSASLGAAFGATNAGPVREVVARNAKRDQLKQIAKAGKASFQTEDFHTQEGVEQQIELAEGMERATMELALMEKDPAKRAKTLEANLKTRQGLDTLNTIYESTRRPTVAEAKAQAQKDAAQRQIEAQQEREDVEKAVERRRAILQGLPMDRQNALVKEIEDGE